MFMHVMDCKIVNHFKFYDDIKKDVINKEKIITKKGNRSNRIKRTKTTFEHQCVYFRMDVAL